MLRKPVKLKKLGKQYYIKASRNKCIPENKDPWPWRTLEDTEPYCIITIIAQELFDIVTHSYPALLSIKVCFYEFFYILHLNFLYFLFQDQKRFAQNHQLWDSRGPKTLQEPGSYYNITVTHKNISVYWQIVIQDRFQ